MEHTVLYVSLKLIFYADKKNLNFKNQNSVQTGNHVFSTTSKVVSRGLNNFGEIKG